MRLPGVDPNRPPPGPFRPDFWRSPLRGRWLTSVLGLILLIGIPIVAITGLISNVAYQPLLGANSIGTNLSPLDLYVFTWPTRPVWLYALTEGLHVTIGLALFPVLLAKLWSVFPRLFEWPPVRSPAHALERISLVLLVGSAMFEFLSGIFVTQFYYPFPFFFTSAHYFGAWVFIGAFGAHVALKFGTMRRGLRTRGDVMEAAGSGAALEPGPVSLTAVSPGPVTMSRRVLLGTVGAGSLLLLVQGAAGAIGGPFRFLSLFGPHTNPGSGPLDFPITETAAAAQITPASVGDAWRLEVVGKQTLRFSREQLLAMPQHTYDLPVACTEGWSTTQRWTGVRLRDLATLAGVHEAATVTSDSVQPAGYVVTLGSEQVADEQSLLALRVNGIDLSLDHGFPARVISPAVPGTHCTKWVSGMQFSPVPA